MADAALLKKAAWRVVVFGVIAGYGYSVLWPGSPLEETFFKLERRDQVIFVLWAIISAGLAWDLLLSFIRGIRAPDPNARPGRR
jgi:hypothetical protein